MKKGNKYVQPELSDMTIGDLLNEDSTQANSHYSPEEESQDIEDDLVLGDEDEMEGDEEEYEVELEEDMDPDDIDDDDDDDLILDTDDDESDEDDEDEM